MRGCAMCMSACSRSGETDRLRKHNRAKLRCLRTLLQLLPARLLLYCSQKGTLRLGPASMAVRCAQKLSPHLEIPHSNVPIKILSPPVDGHFHLCPECASAACLAHTRFRAYISCGEFLHQTPERLILQ